MGGAGRRTVVFAGSCPGRAAENQDTALWLLSLKHKKLHLVTELTGLFPFGTWLGAGIWNGVQRL